MTTTINIFLFPGPPPPASDTETLSGINHNLENIMTQISEIEPLLANINTQLTKARDEIVSRIANLEASLATVELPPEATAALQQLQGIAQVLDDIVPDAPVV